MGSATATYAAQTWAGISADPEVADLAHVLRIAVICCNLARAEPPQLPSVSARQRTPPQPVWGPPLLQLQLQTLQLSLLQTLLSRTASLVSLERRAAKNQEQILAKAREAKAREAKAREA